MADARTEMLRWTHPGGEPAPVRFEASVNDGARINLGFPAPSAEGIYAATIQTEADPARIRAYAIAEDGTSSFPSNEIVRTASGEPPSLFELVVGQDCTSAVPLDGHEAGSWPVQVCPPPARATFDNGRTETSAPISRCGDTGPGKVTPCELAPGQVVTATADGEEIQATVARPFCRGDYNGDGVVSGWDVWNGFRLDWGCSGECRGDYNGDGLVSGADLMAFAAEYASGCP